ncbi:HEAT repeat protein [Oesophagostomum dentatum]|uniref:HEAT repeat protein n=1 Tax=Oesophagostomum dentatum TaxID=61180 RepID=A0A0B1STB1_OESDE|nr:HEAT repeat protein [Oesophagostomum dentatum]
MDATVTQYGNALEAIIEMRPTVGTVTLILKMLQPYYGKLAEHERSRSIDATVQVLRVYLDKAEDITIGVASDFGPLSSLLARLSPRLVDSLALVRHQSLAAIHFAFRLANAYKGHGTHTDSSLFRIEEFAKAYLNNEGRLDTNDAKKAIRKMAEVIESRLPQCQIQTYLSALFEMLTDRQSQVSSAAAQLLTHSLTCRGDTLVHEESAALRAASFSLFGELGARIGGDEEFMAHLHANIVAILLHLNDEDEDVRKACSMALNRIHPLFSVGTFSSVIEREMKDGRLPGSYFGVQRDLASILALSFPDRVNQYALTCSNYFKSSDARIRANAALLTGNMLGVLTPQLRATISKDLIFSSLVLLLKDPEDVSVRIAAARAVGSLHHFS